MNRLKVWLARKLQRFVFRHCPLQVASMLLPETGILSIVQFTAKRIALTSPDHEQATVTEITQLGVRQHLFVLRWVYYGSTEFVKPINQDLPRNEPAEHWQDLPLVNRPDRPEWSKPLWKPRRESPP